MKKQPLLPWLLFLAYSFLMLYLLFGQRADGLSFENYADSLLNNFNLIPFRTVAEYLSFLREAESGALVLHAVINLVGNVVMFVPLGVFLPQLWKGLRKFRSFLLVLVLSIVLIELLQFFSLLGKSDIDDLILNTAGAILGFFLFRRASRLMAKK